MYDTVIIGGGIAGLSIAEHIVNTSNDSVALLERYPNMGGRIVTSHEPYQYEIGAGRIHNNQKLTNNLVKRFGLHTYPISSDSNYNHQPNEFHALFQPLRSVLQNLPQSDLAKHTIAELIPSKFHPILTMFPYYAEMHILRADIALPLFEKSSTMGPTAEYYGIVGGIDQLIHNLQTVLEKTRIHLKTRHRVEDITKHTDNLFEITGSQGKKAAAKPFRIVCKRLILATEYRSFRNFTLLQKTSFLRHLTDSALVRIYAVYPVKPKAWFHDLPKTVTNSPLRFIIPINPSTGLIMISYTEGEDANIWRAIDDEEELQKAVQKEVRALFPDRDIPDPIYIKKHDWPQGCTYWKKGDYNLDETLLEAQNPLPNVYICGESIQKHQSWIESALESVESLKEKLH